MPPESLRVFSSTPKLLTELGQVRLLGETHKPPEQLHDSEEGVMMTKEYLGMTLEDVKYLRKAADGEAVRQSYEVWFTRLGGRKVEKELVAKFNELAKNSKLVYYTASRFQAIVRQGLELLHDDEDSSLLDMCKDAIRAHGKLSEDEFVELQKILVKTNETLHKDISKQSMLEAARRLMPNTTIVQSLLGDA